MISGVSTALVQTFRSPASSLAGGTNASAEVKPAKGNETQSSTELTDEEKTQVEQLKKTDKEVRAHEQAHKNAGGQFAGSASFGYEVGPDGKRYAISGEVPIDIAPVEGDPEATIAKMNAVTAAALAPAKPSGQDRQVAAKAAALRAEAQAELTRQFRTELSGEDTSEEESGTVNSLTLSAFVAYEAGAGNNEKKSGNILDFFS
ncbi:MAG: hypothetical protein JKY45_07415 [Emcibacter sp.]|nr:hypothetical protein [Emcibacter sp.]